MSKVGGVGGSSSQPAPVEQPQSQSTSAAQAQSTQSTQSTQSSQAPGAPPTPQPQTSSPTQASAHEAAHRRSEQSMEATARQAQLQSAAGATTTKPSLTTDDVVKRARSSGLNEAEANQLEARLRGMKPHERGQELYFLRNKVLDQPNADRALRTYTELQDLRASNPTRLSRDTVHTLTRSVAEPRAANAPRGQEGIMGQEQAVNAAKAMTKMPQAEFDRLNTTLSQAGQRNGRAIRGADPQAERALILKTVGARQDELSNPGLSDRIRNLVGYPGRSMGDIQNYAEQIRGTPRDKLVDQSTVLDLRSASGAGALQQRFTDSCTPTSQQIARAEADPIYARRLHQEAIHSTDDQTAIGREQKGILEAHGGVATPRSVVGGTGTGMWPENTLNDNVGRYTNHTYTRTDLANTTQSRQQALDRMDGSLKSGVDVPIVVAWNGGGSHSMLVTDVRGQGTDRKYLVSDPYDGRTQWVSRQQMEGNNTTFIQGPPQSNGRLWITYE